MNNKFIGNIVLSSRSSFGKDEGNGVPFFSTAERKIIANYEERLINVDTFRIETKKFCNKCIFGICFCNIGV